MTETKEIRPREQKMIAEVLRIERANTRRDTAKQKGRGEVRGGGAKPWRQKGSGRARQGSIRSPQWVGGGSAFGTSRANHHLKVNRKVRRKAMATVLEWKKDTDRVKIDALSFDVPSTKQFREFLESAGMSGKVLLLYGSAPEMKNAVKSARNLPNVKLVHVDKINLQALLSTEWLLITPDTAEKLNVN